MATIPFAERPLFLLRVKRIATLRLLLLFMIVFLPGRLHALNFTYTTNSGTVTITGYTGSGGALDIPSMVDGLPVTTINSLLNRNLLTSVTIPASVTLIKYYAFSDCTAMTSISVDPANLNYSSIDGVLYNKSLNELIVCPAGKVGSVNIPNSVTHIRLLAFENCSGLTNVTIPTSVTYIDSRAFENCTGLTTVTIPASVSYMGNDTFTGCTGLTSVSIAANVGRNSFSGCSNLTNVSILAGVTSVSQSDFGGSMLSAFTVDTSNAVFSSLNGVLFNKDHSTVILFPFGKTGAYVIPSSVTSIGDGAFYDCSGLTSVTIPSGVTSIGNWAFCGCSELKSVTIPSSVTSIGNQAFSGCSGLRSVTISSSVTSIGDRAFYDCSRLTAISVDTLNATYSSLGGVLFNKSQTTLIQYPRDKTGRYAIPSGVTSIGDYAFYGCSWLTSVTIPSGVTSIGNYAFYDCSGLTSVTIPSGVTSIGSYAFYDCSGLTSVTIPSGVTSIGELAFYFCSRLKSVTIPSSVTSIESYAFYGCSEMTSVRFLGNAPLMESYVFDGAASGFKVYYTAGASGFTSPTWKGNPAEAVPAAPEIAVEQPVGTDLIDGGVNVAFGDVDLGASVTKTFTIRNLGVLDLTGLAVCMDGTAVGDFALDNLGATSLAPGASTTFAVTFTPLVAGAKSAAIHIASNDADDNPFDINLTGTGITPAYTYTIANGQVIITGYTGSSPALAIPGSIAGLPVTSIGDSVFNGCSGLTSVTIPSGVTSIGNNAFYDCSGLTSVTIPASVTSIGSGAFEGCSGLTSVTIPSGVTSIGSRAFLRCSGLTSVTIPFGVASIGDWTFYDCSGLTSVTIPSSVTSIGSYAFYNCSWLTSVTIASSVTSIGNYAFEGCSGLTSVTIPSSVTSIGNWAFCGCSELTSVTIPSSVTSIGDGAFFDCSRLTAFTVDALNASFSSLGGVLLNKNQTTLIQFPRGKAGSYAIPAIVTSIGSRAFYGCSELTSVTIPSGITSIGNSAFSDCSGLTSVTIPSSVTSIGEGAFYDCSALTRVMFLGNAPSMESYVFASTASGFKVSYTAGASGFTSPTWLGYPAEAVPGSAPEIAVEQPAGTNLIDGSANVAFGTVEPGASVAKTFTIRNLGMLDLTRLALSKGGSQAADYSVTGPVSKTLAPGASTTFTVVFKPTALGSRTAVIHIASNDADENPFDITLTGTGIGNPEIEIQQPAGTNLKDGVTSKSFGSVAMKSSPSKTFTIKNTGTANLTGLAITKTGANSKDFSVKAPLKTSLAPGTSTTFKVIFKPSAKGTRKAVIHIKSNDKDENPFDIALTGKGKANAAARSTLADSLCLLSQPDQGFRQSISTERLSDGRNYLTLTVSKSPTLPHEPVVEVSANLIDWFSGRNHTTVVEDTAASIKVRDNTPIQPGTKRYIRLIQLRQ